MAHSSIASERKTELELVLADIELTESCYQIKMQLKQILNGAIINWLLPIFFLLIESGRPP